MANEEHLEVGTVVAERYRIDGLLGTGGMGAVYAATHLGLDRPVALKRMHARFAFEARHRERFIREAKVVARLSHPAVVEVYDFGQTRGGLYLVMERLEGFTLADFLDLGLPKVEDALAVLRQMCLGLAAAHAIGLVHRDLKPENVFLIGNDPHRVKLVDFGLAFIAGEEGAAGRVTKEAMVSGTPAFVAPETAQALPIGPPADMYAVGIIAFLMLTGELPFAGQAATLLAAHVYQSPPSLRDFGRNVHVGLEDLVTKLLAKVPAQRPTAEEALFLLDGLTDVAPERGRALIDRVRSGTQKMGVPAGILGGRQARVLVDEEREYSTVDYERIAVGPRRILACPAPLDQDAQLALSMRSIDVVVIPRDEPWSAYSKCDALYVDQADAAWAVEHREDTTPIVCAVHAPDATAVSELIRLGVDDVVVAPVAAHDLARKVARAMDKRGRQNASPHSPR